MSAVNGSLVVESDTFALRLCTPGFIKRDNPSRVGTMRQMEERKECDRQYIGPLGKLVVFVSATFVVMFVVFRQSLLWYFEEMLGTSRTLSSSIWALFYRIFGESHFNMNVIGSSVIPFLVYLSSNAFFTYLDLTGKPAALLKYKIQEEKGVPVNWKKYKSAIKLIALNLLVIAPLFNLAVYPLTMWRGIDCSYELPSFLTTMWHLFCFAVVEEIGFYYFHRLLHHPKLYKHCHKIHHEWTAPTGIVSVYAHPIEYVISITLPIWFGPFLMGSHLSVAWLWYAVSMFNTTVSHSGYHLPFFPSNESHDFHHKKFNTNYGVRGIMDYLHGTDNVFRHSKCYDRNIVLFGLRSAHEVFPDPPKHSKQNGSISRAVEVVKQLSMCHEIVTKLRSVNWWTHYQLCYPSHVLDTVKQLSSVPDLPVVVHWLRELY